MSRAPLSRETIAERALPLFLEKPWRNVTIAEVAKTTGCPQNHVYRQFDGREDVYRSAINRMIEVFRPSVTNLPAAQSTVRETIFANVRSIAEIVSSEAYGQLLYVRVRDEPVEPWLRMIFERDVGLPMRESLPIALKELGATKQTEIVLQPGVERRYITELESALAFPKLLEPAEDLAERLEAVVARVVRSVSAATCMVDSVVGGLNAIVRASR